jgi:hypothetical protein
MADKKSLFEQTSLFTSAWDARKRTFDRLRDPRLTDPDREEAAIAYATAAAEFEKLRKEITTQFGAVPK